MSKFGPEDILSSNPDAVVGLQGLSFLPAPSTTGIGQTSDPYRVGDGANSAWRVGQFSFEVLQSTGTNYLYLQIGRSGMRHEGDPLITQGHPCSDGEVCPEGTEVVFGNDNVIYNSHNMDYRQTTKEGDSHEVRINAAGDYNRDGELDPDPAHNLPMPDFDVWKSSFGQSVSTPGDGADGNRDGIVDAADYVLWRKMAAPVAVGLPSPGDYNRDCSCDWDDFLYWKSSFGLSVSSPGDGADGNRDSVVDAADYVFWRRMFELTGGSVSTFSETASHATVPEPATGVLACVLFGHVLSRYRRCRALAVSKCTPTKSSIHIVLGSGTWSK
jgi:hypothetical protein